MTDDEKKAPDDLGWMRHVLEAAARGPWTAGELTKYPSVPIRSPQHAQPIAEVLVCPLENGPAIALFGSVGRELLAVVEAFDDIVDLARDVASDDMARHRDVQAAVCTRDKLHAALAAARERAGR